MGGVGEEEGDDLVLGRTDVLLFVDLGTAGDGEEWRPAEGRGAGQVDEQSGVCLHEPGGGLGSFEVPAGPVDVLGDS